MKSGEFKLSVVDTDSIAVSKSDYSPWTKKEKISFLNHINSLMEEGILWTDDGEYNLIGVVGAKNYILFDGKKTKIKGSALKATKKEPRFRQFINNCVQCIIENRVPDIQKLYQECVDEILSISKDTDITLWVFKNTVTNKVINPTTAFNQKVLNGLISAKVPIVEGDKHHFFYDWVSEIKTEIVIKKDPKTGVEKPVKKKTQIQHLKHISEFNGQNICKITLLRKLYATIKTFHRIIDISEFKNMALKSNIKGLGSNINNAYLLHKNF